MRADTIVVELCMKPAELVTLKAALAVALHHEGEEMTKAQRETLHDVLTLLEKAAP